MVAGQNDKTSPHPIARNYLQGTTIEVKNISLSQRCTQNLLDMVSSWRAATDYSGSNTSFSSMEKFETYRSY